MDTTLISKCCRVEAREDYKPHPRDKHEDIDIWVCTKCEKECEVEEVCGFCLGTGEVSVDEDDGEGHTARGVGTRKCTAAIHADEPERADD